MNLSNYSTFAGNNVEILDTISHLKNRDDSISKELPKQEKAASQRL